MQIHVDSNAQTIKLWQEKYINKLVQKFNVIDKKVQVPMPYDKRLEPTTDADERADAELYRSKLGSIRRALLYIGLFQGGRGCSSAMKMATVLVVLSCLVPKASVITSE